MKKFLALITALILVLGSCAALAAPDEVAFAPSEERISVTIGRTTMPAPPEFGNGDDFEHNKYLDYISEKTNMDISYEWIVDSSSYNQKVNLAITSGDIPDVMFITSKEQLQQLVENDLIEDLTGLADQYFSDYILNIYNSYADKGVGSCTFDDKVYAIPNLEAGYSFAMLWVRKDWADAIGAEIPTTMDGIIDLARQFMEKDPGHNGAGNTVGIAVNNTVGGVYNSIASFDPVFHYFGSFPRQWVRSEDGKVGYGTVTEETKKALSFIADIYKEGILDPEFVVRTSDDLNALLLSGKCGIFFGPWWMSDWPLGTAKTSNPECDWVPVLAPIAEDGNFYAYKQDENVSYVVVRKGYEHPEAAFKILNWTYIGMRGFDPSVEDFYPGANIHWTVYPLPLLLNYDDECVTISHTLEKAVAERNTEGLDPQNQNFYANIIKWLDEQDPDCWKTYISRIYAPGLEDAENVVFVDNIYPARTDTMDLKLTQLEKIEDEAILKIIMGEMSIDEFDSFVSNWYAQGGQEITDEVNEVYGK